MKYKLYQLLIHLLVVGIILIPSYLVASGQPPDPGGDPTGGGIPVGGGAPLGNGFGILVCLAICYFIWKLYHLLHLVLHKTDEP
jgi:hypothetical protein